MKKYLIMLCFLSMCLIIAAGDMDFDVSLDYNSLQGLYRTYSQYSGNIEAGIYNRFNSVFEVGFGAGYTYAYVDYFDSVSSHNHFLSLFIGGKINIYEDFGIFKGKNSYRTIYISPRAWHRITEDVFEFYPGLSLGIRFSNKLEKFTWGSKIIYHMIYSDNEYVPSSILGFGIFIAF